LNCTTTVLKTASERTTAMASANREREPDSFRVQEII